MIKHGIRMAGMPAWETRLPDADMWAIVAYLQVLPQESPPQYRASTPARAIPAVEPTQTHTPATPDPERGRIAIERYACATCHVIPGIVGARTTVGPPLTRMASRAFIAGILPNTIDNMTAWLQAPLTFYPEGAMPNLGVSQTDARDIAAFLSTLK